MLDLQEAEVDVHEDAKPSSASNFLDDNLFSFIADWVVEDLDEYCSLASAAQLLPVEAAFNAVSLSGKHVRFSEEISHVEPEAYIVEIVAYLRAASKAKKETAAYGKECRAYAWQWQVYMEYWQQANICALQQTTMPTKDCNEEQ